MLYAAGTRLDGHSTPLEDTAVTRLALRLGVLVALLGSTLSVNRGAFAQPADESVEQGGIADGESLAAEPEAETPAEARGELPPVFEPKLRFDRIFDRIFEGRAGWPFAIKQDPAGFIWLAAAEGVRSPCSPVAAPQSHVRGASGLLSCPP